jgi:tRNA pseudouridine38-40 synthase
LLHELNDRLPPDINVLRVEEASPQFDPRRDAVARVYLYQIARRRSAFAKRFVWWVKDSLDERSMLSAASALVGRRDFALFCDKRVGEVSTVVVVNEAQLRACGDLLLFRIVASHYLWKMVRRIVGALVELGRGSISKAEFVRLLEPSTRGGSRFDVAAHTAPPSGLFLAKVAYDKAEESSELVPAFPLFTTKQD